MRLYEFNQSKDNISRLNKFVDWVCEQIGVDDRPTVKFGRDLEKVKKLRTFGSTTSNGDIWVHIDNRNLADTLRTLAHELIHFKQFGDGTAGVDMDEEQRQYIEDEANALAGRLMREYGKQHEDIYENKNIR